MDSHGDAFENVIIPSLVMVPSNRLGIAYRIAKSICNDSRDCAARIRTVDFLVGNSSKGQIPMDNNKQAEYGTGRILIFPGGMPRSLEYLEKCMHKGKSVIGASSLVHDHSRNKYPSWFYLPYITQPEFDDALRDAISEFQIEGIYSPNIVVWNHINRILKRLAPNVVLVNESPVSAELSGYRIASANANALIKDPLPLALNLSAKAHMSAVELSALFRHADVIPGMCDHEKMCALCEIARSSPLGDIVEIGSWWGKSAFVLARLATCYGIGKLLCVDPWSNRHLVQNDEKGLVDSGSSEVDAEEALTVFEMNLLPYNSRHINFLRMPSTEGAKHYQEYRNAITAAFGTTDYCGHIAILHIDGNHKYESVKEDIASWSGFVVEGGWIVLDDYRWPYGDGPKRAADEYLDENHQSIDNAFVMGGALFIHLTRRRSEH